MPIGETTRERLEANIAQSEQHVVKQEAIIARLTEQGHEELAAEARAILKVMHEHLRLEGELLAIMRAD